MQESIPKERSLLQGVFYYANIIKEGWKIILISTVVLGGLTFLYGIVTKFLPPDINPMPNTYVSYTALLLENGQTTDISNLMTSMGYGEQQEVDETAQFIITILNSKPILNYIIKNYKIKEVYNIDKNANLVDIRAFLLSKASFGYNPRTRRFIIQYEDESRVKAKMMVDAFSEALKTWLTEFGGSRSAKQVKALEETLNYINDEIINLETKINSFQEQYKVLTVDEIASSQNTMLDTLREQLVAIEIELKNYESFTRVEDTALLRLKTQKNNILELIRQTEAGYSGGQKRFPPKSELPSLSLQFTKLNMDLGIQRRLYESISERYEIARLSAAQEIPYYVLEEAEIPTDKSGPQRGKMVMMATMAGAFLGVALVLLIYFIKLIKEDPEKFGLSKGELH